MSKHAMICNKADIVVILFALAIYACTYMMSSQFDGENQFQPVAFCVNIQRQPLLC